MGVINVYGGDETTLLRVVLATGEELVITRTDIANAAAAQAIKDIAVLESLTKTVADNVSTTDVKLGIVYRDKRTDASKTIELASDVAIQPFVAASQAAYDEVVSELKALYSHDVDRN